MEKKASLSKDIIVRYLPGPTSSAKPNFSEPEAEVTVTDPPRRVMKRKPRPCGKTILKIYLLRTSTSHCGVC